MIVPPQADILAEIDLDPSAGRRARIYRYRTRFGHWKTFIGLYAYGKVTTLAPEDILDLAAVLNRLQIGRNPSDPIDPDAQMTIDPDAQMNIPRGGDLT